jgi:hypothetical protein
MDLPLKITHTRVARLQLNLFYLRGSPPFFADTHAKDAYATYFDHSIPGMPSFLGLRED